MFKCLGNLESLSLTTENSTSGGKSSADSRQARRPLRPSLQLGSQRSLETAGRARPVPLGTTLRGRSFSSSTNSDVPGSRKPRSLGEGMRRHSASDFRQSQLAMSVTLSRISEDSDTAHSAGELHQVTSEASETSHLKSDMAGVGRHLNQPSRPAQGSVGVKSFKTDVNNAPHQKGFDLFASDNSPTRHRNDSQENGSIMSRSSKLVGRREARASDGGGSQKEISFRIPEADNDPLSERRCVFSRRSLNSPPPKPSLTEVINTSPARDKHAARNMQPVFHLKRLENSSSVRYSSPSHVEESLVRAVSPGASSLVSADSVSVKSGSSTSCCSQDHILASRAIDTDTELEPVLPPHFEHQAEADRRHDIGSFQSDVVVDIEENISPGSSLVPRRHSLPTRTDRRVKRQSSGTSDDVFVISSSRLTAGHAQSTSRGGFDTDKPTKKHNRVHPL